MKKTFIIKNEHDAEQLQFCIHTCLQDEELTPVEVVVHAGACSRSVQQNRLMWLWNTEIANHMGLTKDEVHELLKRKFAKPIFTKNNLDYANMVEAVRNVYKQGMLLEGEHLAKEIIRLTSTSDFTTDEMAEYLKDIEHFAASEGIALSIPLA